MNVLHNVVACEPQAGARRWKEVLENQIQIFDQKGAWKYNLTLKKNILVFLFVSFSLIFVYSCHIISEFCPFQIAWSRTYIRLIERYSDFPEYMCDIDCITTLSTYTTPNQSLEFYYMMVMPIDFNSRTNFMNIKQELKSKVMKKDKRKYFPPKSAWGTFIALRVVLIRPNMTMSHHVIWTWILQAVHTGFWYIESLCDHDLI